LATFDQRASQLFGYEKVTDDVPTRHFFSGGVKLADKTDTIEQLLTLLVNQDAYAGKLHWELHWDVNA
jgi:hypothetical protein